MFRRLVGTALLTIAAFSPVAPASLVGHFGPDAVTAAPDGAHRAPDVIGEDRPHDDCVNCWPG